MKDIIFVLWGSHAYNKISLINQDKHHTIISSHPSGFSANTPFRNYPAFMNEDHFGKINKILEKTNRTKILWN
jgi:uracil-DNA glycosylase